MNTLSGMGKLDRERITSILRATQQTISVIEAAKILGLSREHSAKLLARWAINGWLVRIKRGVYISVPLESTTADIPLEDPWAIAERLYHPCYIGAWSAAEHWGLTEQIFRTVVVLTNRKPRDHHPTMRGTQFWLRTVSEEAMFGLKSIWHGQSKILISDPTRTILDFLVDPKLGGGIRNVVGMFKEYLKSEHKNLKLLIDYADRLHNNAVFKRLGFLLEQCVPEELNLIFQCKKRITISKVKLDPHLDTDNKLITRWRLWVPKNWTA